MKNAIVFIGLMIASISSQAGDWAQIGSNWDKAPFTQEKFASASSTTQKAAMALGHISGGATSFYIGKISGKHLAVTNHHVYPFGCRDEMIEFPFMKHTFRCTNLIGTWPQIDTTIFELSVPKPFEDEILPHALKFAFEKDVTPGQKLLTMGFGHNRNGLKQPMLDDSEDCKVYSAKNEFRLLLDPDQNLYPGDPDFFAWSLAHACESSQGDSGSAILDRETAEVVAILWTMKSNRAERFQDSSYLNSLITNPNEDVWTQMNYGVPVRKVKEIIAADVMSADSKLDEEQKATLKALLGI